MDRDQRQFWEDLLAYYRQELKERQDPAMVSLLGIFRGSEHALKDKRLAEEGYVYLLKDGELHAKRFAELNPADAPYLMAEIEAGQALAGEHSTVEGDVTVTEVPGGGTFTHPHYEDASGHLRERWERLRSTWDAR